MGHKSVELDLEGAGEEGLHRRLSTYCNSSSAAVGIPVLQLLLVPQTAQEEEGHTLSA